MADGALHPDLCSATAAAPEGEAWAERQLAQLQELAQIGMVLARRLPEEDRAEGADHGQVALSFSRISQSIRYTQALECRLRQALSEGRCAAQAARRTQALAERKLHLRRAARLAIDDHQPIAARGGLRFRLDERIEELADDDEGHFLDRPLSTVLGDICEDLGLHADWFIWRDADWAVAEMAERPPGSDYVDFHDDMVVQGLWDPDADDLDEDDPDPEEPADDPPDPSEPPPS